VNIELVRFSGLGIWCLSFGTRLPDGQVYEAQAEVMAYSIDEKAVSQVSLKFTKIKRYEN
jgi:hypothetical protein